MSISRVRQISEEGYNGGNQWESSFRKVPALASTAGVWTDLSSAPGNPKPNYYTGLELTATTLDGTTGIFHGGSVSPKTKVLHRVLIQSTSAGVVPATFQLLDYLAFYPLIDMDVTDEQEFTNPAPLPRYADGVGVKAFLVATNPYIGGASFTIRYTDHLGQERVSPPALTNTSTTITSILNSGLVAGAQGAFIPLAHDSRGIRSVQGITFLAPNGGLASLVLVRPIATMTMTEITAPSEWDFIAMKPTLPVVQDGAYLNFIVCPNGSIAAAPITGLASFVWS